MVRIMVVGDDQFQEQEVKSLLQDAKASGQEGSGRTLCMILPLESHASRNYSLDGLVAELLDADKTHRVPTDATYAISPRSNEVLVLEPLGNGTKGYFLKQGRHKKHNAVGQDLLLAA